ncbi:MAG: bifunctional ADP-heptose synthase [Bacteroidota bacterium]
MNDFKTIEAVFEAYNHLKVLIIGDVMVDSYISGLVERISPEAPVPVVFVTSKEDRLGGAANVALNIRAMGATPILCTVIGQDFKGEKFLELMKEKNISTEGILRSGKRRTTVKTRVLGNNHQMLRIDEENEDEITNDERELLVNRVKSLIETDGINVIIFEDYDKGIISEQLIDVVVAIANSHKIPIAVDPKKKNFNAYKSVTLFKPNLKELKEGLKIEVDKNNKESLTKAAGFLHDERNIGLVMITLSEAGVFMSNNDFSNVFPAHIRNIVDVSGAGDTVISVAALSLALGLSPTMIGTISNLSGGLVCEKAGVVPIDKKQLLEEAKQMNLKL